MTKAEYDKALYNIKKSEKRCVCCGQQDERTLSGKVLCIKCHNVQRSYLERHRDEKKDRSAYNRERRRRLLEIGICPRCGKNHVAPKRKNCAACLAKGQLYREMRRKRVLT